VVGAAAGGSVRVAGIYSFNRGKEEVTKHYPVLLNEVFEVIKAVDSSKLKTKKSTEKTMMGRMLFNPRAINTAFKRAFTRKGGWPAVRVPCSYPDGYYVDDYKVRSQNRGAFREMDFVKQKLGVEVQFGKYAFMVYNVCAKMTIFHNFGHINHGIEIVPVKAFADEMSTGVSYFEQFIWDLEHRGVSNIDIPVMILGIDA
jgi:Restriction endonuclease BglII